MKEQIDTLLAQEVKAATLAGAALAALLSSAAHAVRVVVVDCGQRGHEPFFEQAAQFLL